MDYAAMSLKLHEEHVGKLEIRSKVSVSTRDDLSIAYTPGVAEPCRRISSNPEEVYRYTSKGNMVAVVTDGTAVLGLGDIGPKAALPVMEGKAVLFKAFANVDAIPVCVDTKDPDEIVHLVKMISPSLGGVNLEDISAPRCFEIEHRLKAELDIPVFHDDQHGTAIVVSAALINALKVVRKRIETARVVVNGAGAAGTSIVKMLQNLGVSHVVVCDREGILHRNMNHTTRAMAELAAETNPDNLTGLLADALAGADVFIGVSAAGVVSEAMVAAMAPDAIVFAMANPEPEIMPDKALRGGARIVGTGRSDFPNQINNVLAFPGIFRGALDVRASDINEPMKVAAAYAIAGILTDEELHEGYVIPGATDPRVGQQVAAAVAQAAIDTGVARI